MHQYPLIISVLALFGAACVSSGGQKITPSSEISEETQNKLTFQSKTIQFSGDASAFHLQLLHNSDQESGIEVLNDLPRFAKALDVLKKQEPNTVFLSSGDLFIPGPFFNATRGKGDIRLANILGYQASSLGNHEFDLGEKPLQKLIKAKKNYPGVQFPLLSSNLDFSKSILSEQYSSELKLANQMGNKITPSVLIEVGGETIGVVGATTESLHSISSPGNVIINPIAAQIQKEVDRIEALGVNKIILLAHLQQLRLEIALAEKLRGVDIIVAGGSDTLLAKATDRLRKGHERKGDYPILLSDEEKKPVLLVNTSREYFYIGRLIVDFDANGVLTGFSKKSGIIATDEDMEPEYQAGIMPDGLQNVLNEIRDRIILLDGEIVGSTDTFLNGERERVRTEETNLGNLLADVLWEEANNISTTMNDIGAEDIVVHLNGGGIRASIGDIEPGPLGRRVPPLANPLVNKKMGEISILDVKNAFRFNNEMVMAKVTGAEFIDWVEFGVANYEIGVTAGRFPQVAGVQFSFDPKRPGGERVKTLVIHGKAGPIVLMKDFQKTLAADKTYLLATCAFLAKGGDGYPALKNIIHRFAKYEQDLVVSGLKKNSPLQLTDPPPQGDTRIQNLLFREDTILK